MLIKEMLLGILVLAIITQLVLEFLANNKKKHFVEKNILKEGIKQSY